MHCRMTNVLSDWCTAQAHVLLMVIHTMRLCPLVDIAYLLPSNHANAMKIIHLDLVIFATFSQPTLSSKIQAKII